MTKWRKTMKLKKTIAAFSCAVLTICPVTAQFSSSMTANAKSITGECGQNLTWEISGDTLTIKGEGESIPDYRAFNNKAPWREYSSRIKKLILPDTLKKIGKYAFFDMNSLSYIYTHDSYDELNYPYLPDLSEISSYAFYNCTSLRGNTQSGLLEFGTRSVPKHDSLTIENSAFNNCTSIRMIRSNYDRINIEPYCFYSATSLGWLDFENTTAAIGECAFKNCKGLSNVDIKQSTLPISNTAFLNTDYYGNCFTSKKYEECNYGAAREMTGDNLIVNFFIDRSLQMDCYDLDDPVNRKKEIVSRSEEDYNLHLNDNEIAIITDQGDQTYIYVYDKDKMKYKYNPRHSWQVTKADNGMQDVNSAISLNSLDYNTLNDQSSIPIDVAENGVTDGFLGSYVKSDRIKERLDVVNNSMTELQKYAEKYGKEFNYQMHPETNFYITYGAFNWETTPRILPNFGNPKKLNYDLTIGYGEGVKADFGIGEKPMIREDELFTSILSKSQKLTGENAHEIDLNVPAGKEMSDYTVYLKNKYHVDNVIYLIHIYSPQDDYRPDAHPNKNKNEDRTDEFCVICSKEGKQDGVIAHEICHLFGALDYYDSQHDLSGEAKDFVSKHYSKELMNAGLLGVDEEVISCPTAYSIGWLDKIDSRIYDLFFAAK